jgi:RecA-family ATPase
MTQADQIPAEPFTVRSIGEMCAAVDGRPAPQFVVRGLLIEGDYGVLGAQHKFGKTWIATDLGVNVAAGGSFLGVYPIDKPGTVIVFAGEGGERKIVRRSRAVAAHYGIELDTIPLYFRGRAPKLADLDQVERLRLTVEQMQPVLVIIDPAYLALAGAETSNLASMGVLLERVQYICQSVGAALLLTHHWNKTGTGSGAERFTGTGFAEWGRVLFSGSTLSMNDDKATKETNAVLKLEIVGDEIADTEIIFRRRVSVDDPDDISSPMHYSIEPLAHPTSQANPAAPPRIPGMKPAASRVYAILVASGLWLDKGDIGDELATTGFPLQARTILEACQTLVDGGLIDTSPPAGQVRATWRARSGNGNAP